MDLEKEIDGMDSYPTVKQTLKYAFKISKGNK